MASPQTNDAVVTQLNSFLRGEISSVETYKQALEKVKDPQILAKIQDVEQDHERRVETLTQKILELGGQPSTGSGVWGAWAKLVEGTATLAGEKQAVNALESGEDHGLADYKADLDKLDASTRQFVESNLLQAQLKTHGVMSALKKTLN